MTPLQSPKQMCKNPSNIQAIRKSTTLSEIKKLIPLTEEHLKTVYRLKFPNDNPEDRLVLEQFTNPTLTDLIKSFMAYIILYDENEGYEPYAQFFAEIRTEARFLYRMIMGRLLGRIRDYLRILVMLSYFVFFFLVDMDFYDLSANHLNFLVFCFEVVHFEINGINIQPEALRKTILHKFQNNYKVPKINKSLINVRVPPSSFDGSIRSRLSAYIRKNAKQSLDAEQFKAKLESKVDTIKSTYKSMVDDFKEDLERFKKKKDKSFELQHVKFQAMKKDRFKSQSKSRFARLSKEQLNINSMSQGLVDSTFNPKKQHFISKLSRDHSGRGRRVQQVQTPR